MRIAHFAFRALTLMWCVAAPLLAFAVEAPSSSGPDSHTVVTRQTAACGVADPELQEAYHGGCLAGLAHGQGIARGRDGAFYQGNFVKGTKSGYGVKLYANGDAYAGHWQADYRHGHGVYEFGERSAWRGDKYIGLWERDQRHGRGAYLFYPTGESFMADWVEGQTEAFASPMLIRRKRTYEALLPVLGQVGLQVCSTLTDGASAQRVAHGRVVAVEGERIHVHVETQAVLENSKKLVLNPRWDLMTEWMRCAP